MTAYTRLQAVAVRSRLCDARRVWLDRVVAPLCVQGGVVWRALVTVPGQGDLIAPTYSRLLAAALCSPSSVGEEGCLRRGAVPPWPPLRVESAFSCWGVTSILTFKLS